MLCEDNATDLANSGEKYKVVDVYMGHMKTYLLKGVDGESSNNRGIKQQSEPVEVETMANKAVDEMGRPQKASTRVKSITKKQTPKTVRKQSPAANANSEASSPVITLEDAAKYIKGTENMEATDASENMQGKFDGEITPLDGGENLQGGI
ncbi:hypothetical protein ACH5RR_040491 [Cinchona calisaya]|uniref:Uncharacterized protein n=1 Tax=Cinchona calisaya TaxID=153742 RepID=A0ABD2XRY7_9GENT